MLTRSFQRNHGTPIEQVAAKGYDLQFGTIVVGALSHNSQRISQPDFVLGHFYFTTLLIPALLADAKSSLDGKARGTRHRLHHY